MNDVLLIVLLIVGFCTVLLVIAWVQEGREMERKKAAKRAKREAKQSRLDAVSRMVEPLVCAGNEVFSRKRDMKEYRIRSVCVVEGKDLKGYWRDNMQKIYADPPPSSEHDFYIDNMPGKQHGFFDNREAGPGFDWAKHVGQTVRCANVIPYSGFMWLNIPCG